VRRRPACRSRLPILTVTDPTRLLRFLCRRCWATLRPNPAEFARYTLVGAMLGLAVVLLLFMILAAGPYDLANIFYFPLAGGWIGGRFLQRLEVEDPPIPRDGTG